MRKQRLFYQQCAVNPRVVAGWGESWWWTVQSCRGIARFSILNTDENRDDQANINTFKYYDSGCKRHFHVLTMAA